MKHICFDYGQKRVGVAASDAGGGMAFPRLTLWRKNADLFWNSLLALLREEQAEALVVGLPLRADGSYGLAARQARNFARSLKRRTGLPVFYMEEAYSSIEAECMLRESGQGFKPGDGKVDSLAAARILQSFLHQPEHKEMEA
ncbi:MAG: Holliday junction resolvase RuvX [Deltaproteobacteria bacterium]|nr:Holliday junction resolvase RuvX [Deltaproteobacteria bacterium]